MGDLVEGGVDPGAVSGVDARVQGAGAVGVGVADGDHPVAALCFEAAVVGGGVGLDDLGLGQGEDPGGCLGGGGVGDRGVDEADLVGLEASGQGGDLAGEPDLDLPVAHEGPGGGEAVAQVEGVGEGGAGREGVAVAGDGELGQAELADQGGAVSAELDEAVTAAPAPGCVGVVAGVLGVEVGPGQGQLEVLDLCGSPGDERCFCSREDPGGVEVVDRDQRERQGHDTHHTRTNVLAPELCTTLMSRDSEAVPRFD